MSRVTPGPILILSSDSFNAGYQLVIAVIIASNRLC